ncbi:outer membrane protein assembly factor BamB family protein [Bremerella sp. T1]|uniref:outer membrane protein assembly factor BamB family protein n=1 Tax=Bremerella sp. TYQ1 TaxID=3119568 RepID=UPI001CC9308E|nr:PQQ-binding-like beta-propeller repeat protein [Bremerella volcania]UBM38796.1 PQQ-binding-like beta-propeller repeat protein [Bremerella volcania]
MQRNLSLLLSVFAILAIAFPLQAENWPRFRGPTQAGIAAEESVPTQWSDTQNIVWKTDMPGPGASSPVVFNNRIYVTCWTGYGMNEEDPGEKTNLKRHLLCIDQSSGKILWNKEIPADAEHTKDFSGFVALHGYASSTPNVDDTGVYVYYGTTGAAAYDLDGTHRWTVSLGDQTHAFGTANSPVLYKDLVILNAGVEGNAIVGLDKKSGEEVWKHEGVNRSWNTPILITANGRDELIYSEEGAVRALDPATGKEIWHSKGIDDYICPSVIPVGDMVVAMGARKNTTIAIKTGGTGDVTDTNLVWELDKGSNVSSPTYHDGHLYWVSESKGIAYCADAKTGEVVYQERMEPRPKLIYASPVVAGGKLYYVTRENGTYVLAAKPEYELITVNEFETDDSIANGSPAIVDGKMYLRTNKTLYCIGQ